MDKRFKPLTPSELMQARRQLVDELTRDPSITIPNTIRKIRQTMRMTIAEYAKICQVSSRTLADIERAETSPTLVTVEKLLRPMGMQLIIRPVERKDINSSAISATSATPAIPVQAQHSTSAPEHINIHEKWELDYWSQKLGVSSQVIVDVTEKLDTTLVKDVVAYLKSFD